MESNISQEENRRIIINDLVKKRGSIVPIIGDDTLVFQDTDKEIPFQEFIVHEFQKKYPFVEVAKDVLTSMKERGYYGLSLLSQYFNLQGCFLDDFMEFVNMNMSRIKMKQEVQDFLVTFNFPIVITTICFDFIEKQLKNQVERYESIWYKLNKENRNFKIKRCVYHIFGQAKDGTKWVYDEDLLLKFLLSHNNQVYSAVELTDYLKENDKKLLVLGCNLPNWLFRFLWQPTQAGKNSNMLTKQGYWIHKEKPEDSFENFLKKKNFSADEQINEILRDATELLQNEQQRETTKRDYMMDTELHFDVFISYASEDRQIATRIFEALKGMNVNAWFDDKGMGEITPGHPYWEKIEKGIKNSAHFMPIITGNWMNKQTNTSSLKDETNLVRDWLNECNKTNSTKQLKSNYSIPVIIKDSSYNGVAITEAYIEQVAGCGVLPQSLFKGIDMIVFDETDSSVFERIEW